MVIWTFQEQTAFHDQDKFINLHFNISGDAVNHFKWHALTPS